MSFYSGNSPKIRLKITVISSSMYVPKTIGVKIGEVTRDKKGVDASNVTVEGLPDGKGLMEVARDWATERIVTKAWRQAEPNITETGRLLGVSKPTALKYLKKLKLLDNQ